MPLFSVIIPLYNKERHVAATLNSVIAQTFTDFEIIIVNDGSTDGSEDAVKSFNDPRIIYVRTENKGVSSARNTAIQMANGTLIAFLDADDDILPNHLQVLHSLYSNHPEAGMFASRYYFKLPGNKLQKSVFNSVIESFTGIVPDFFASSLNHRMATSSSIAVPKSVFETTGLFNENYTNCEDTDMWVRIGINYPVALSNEYTAVYNFHIADSLSKNSLDTQKVMDFNNYIAHENTNPGLKQYLDLYRIEYAIKYRLQGNIMLSTLLLENVLVENISLSKKILLALPPAVLKTLLFIKKRLYNNGIIVGN
jgi:glycosyltransferase involved in cell wall biosynthesis